MEVFVTFGLIVLVGMAIPITLLFAALVFDLVVALHAMLPTKPIRKRKPRSVEYEPGRLHRQGQHSSLRLLADHLRTL